MTLHSSSKKFNNIHIEGRKKVISMLKKENRLNKGKKKVMSATWDQFYASASESGFDEK